MKGRCKKMIDEITKNVLDVCDMKHDVVKIMLLKATDNKVSNEEIERFVNYLNVIVKSNKSSNNLNNRITSLFKVIKEHYKEYSRINAVITNK
jgi:hypothetical protein